METWETFRMSRKRYTGLGSSAGLAGQITNQEGAGAKLTIRQFLRVKARYRAEGLRGLGLLEWSDESHRHRPIVSKGP